MKTFPFILLALLLAFSAVHLMTKTTDEELMDPSKSSKRGVNGVPYTKRTTNPKEPTLTDSPSSPKTTNGLKDKLRG